jgi:hypothetical protein
VTARIVSEDWQSCRQRHQQRVSAVLARYLAGRNKPNPVIDFLFTYYNLKPGQLMRWHPGFGVTLTGPGAEEYADLRGYCRVGDGVTVSRLHLEKRRATIEYVAGLMAATAGRQAGLRCFGLHEWAMVYGTDDLRHRWVPLRLGSVGTDAVVESLPLRCTHYDAFRFFSEPARPRNVLALSRSSQVETEQPGCLHAAMDLYKFTAKLLPLVDSDLLMEAFELAYDCRELDMRASPYDLTSYGYSPVRIETAAGRAQYVRLQGGLSARSGVVREALLARCRELLAASSI